MNDNSGEKLAAQRMTAELWRALDGAPEMPGGLEMAGEGSLPSVFAVSDFAASAIATAGLALAEWSVLHGDAAPAIRVDRRLASLWFGFSVAPQGWPLPPVWDAIAGDYRSSDGWIRLHTNAPHHRAAALSVLGVAAERDVVAAAVAGWNADALEAAIVSAGGCAATMHRSDAWRLHPQGRAVMAEPLMHHKLTSMGAVPRHRFEPKRPLAGVKVLDLTRVLAGPVATRFLAGFGAEVLRVDPPGWDEGAIVPDVTLGKRCARLDLKSHAGCERFKQLLADADVLVHGYRADALEALGLGEDVRREIRPGLIDVAHNAYGWTGAWRNRRGFDSLVQMSSGIAEAGMIARTAGHPVPLPVQALDHGTGYLLAAATLRGLTLRAKEGRGSVWRTSLVRVAEFLKVWPHRADETGIGEVDFGEPEPDDFCDSMEPTDWGPALRLRAPVTVGAASMSWATPATRLGSSSAAWAGS
ncbi:CoA transferase family III [Hoeflea halophila]|uniref:CoA transferase family III n=1 Tax=Hoeflea halophila TaxID=714899 RepID=A0A286HLT8_9HYPH|nr:CoA transferase [Hoeflea halophila]SOE08780.1 CoA transferase family III [Hoeflea halophila]